jgi:hypothetical protein
VWVAKVTDDEAREFATAADELVRAALYLASRCGYPYRAEDLIADGLPQLMLAAERYRKAVGR